MIENISSIFCNLSTCLHGMQTCMERQGCQTKKVDTWVYSEEPPILVRYKENRGQKNSNFLSMHWVCSTENTTMSACSWLWYMRILQMGQPWSDAWLSECVPSVDHSIVSTWKYVMILIAHGTWTSIFMFTDTCVCTLIECILQLSTMSWACTTPMKEMNLQFTTDKLLAVLPCRSKCYIAYYSEDGVTESREP